MNTEMKLPKPVETYIYTERAMQEKHLGNLEGKMELNRNEQ
jgi:hypothetical protein